MRKGETVWRETGDGHGVTLVATDAVLAAIGIEPETSAATEPAPKARTPREGTKQASLIAMLRTPDGATIEEIMVATGWQSHTVRGAKEETRSRGDLGEGREARAGLLHPLRC